MLELICWCNSVSSILISDLGLFFYNIDSSLDSTLKLIALPARMPET